MREYLHFELAYETQQALSAWGADLSPKIEKAVGRALKRASEWLKRETVAKSAKAVGITRKPLKSRFRVYQKPDGIKFWVGLLNLQADEVGVPTQNSKGVRVRNRQFDRAFYRAVYGSGKQVYIRARANRFEAHPVYRDRPARSRSGSALTDPKLKGRFPLQRVGFDVEREVMEAIHEIEPKLNEVYLSLLDQELGRALSK